MLLTYYAYFIYIILVQSRVRIKMDIDNKYNPQLCKIFGYIGFDFFNLALWFSLDVSILFSLIKQ